MNIQQELFWIIYEYRRPYCLIQIRIKPYWKQIPYFHWMYWTQTKYSNEQKNQRKTKA